MQSGFFCAQVPNLPARSANPNGQIVPELFFKVDKFTTPSGETAWRVSSTLSGTRFRRNFKSKAEAQAEKQKLDIKALNEQSEGQTV